MKENNFIKAMQFRFACKKFDPSKQIPQDEFEAIIESGRLSPSSFGMEPTRLLIVRNKELKEKIRPLCWDQAQITDSSELIVYLSKIADLQSTSNYATRMFARKTKDEQSLKAYKDVRYHNFLQENSYINAQEIFDWSAKQAYITASSMMNCAAYFGIDSCAIEGFERKTLEKLLNLDTFSEQIALLVAFGYRIENPKYKSPRIDTNEFITYIN